jgi:hypothetical protein
MQVSTIIGQAVGGRKGARGDLTQIIFNFANV